MSDLSRAAEILKSDPTLTCVLVRGEEVLESRKSGVRPLIELVERGRATAGASAADRIVGRAAALLYVLLGVRAVYAGTMSRPAAEVLSRYGLEFEYETLCEGIVNRRGDGPCPMEAATRGILDPEEGYRAIKKKLAELAG